MADTHYSELYDVLVDKLNNPAVNWNDVAEVRERYGVHENIDTLRKGSKIFYEFLNAGWKMIPPDNNTPAVTKETVTINSDKTETSERAISVNDETQLKDCEYLLRAHGYNPDLFEITQARNSKWQSGDRTLYSSRITVRPKIPEVIDVDRINELFKRIEPIDVKAFPKTPVHPDADKLLVVSISDLHMNLRASKMITGNDYDCVTADSCVKKIIDDVTVSINTNEIERIIFTIGGDMLNADNQNNTTTKGTPQDCEKHLFEAFEDVLRTVYDALYDLMKIAPVDIVYIPGNHDETVGWFLAKVLEAGFSTTDKVTVDVSPLPRKYYQFGNTLLAFAHTANEKQLPAIVADEAREYWSKVKYTDVFLQHLHSEQVLVEDHNMRIQRLPTVCAMSKWTNDSGYKSRRMNKSFIYDREYGLRSVLYTSVD